MKTLNKSIGALGKNELINNKNFRNNQNYVLGNEDKIKKSFDFLNQANDNYIFYFFSRVFYYFYLLLRKINISFKYAFYIIFTINTFLLIGYLVFFPFYLILFLFLLFILYIPGALYIQTSRVTIYKYRMKLHGSQRTLRAKGLSYFIDKQYIIFKKNYKNMILKYDFLINPFKKD